MSAFPETSSVAASSSPVSVTLRKLATSLFESAAMTLLAATVPAVTSSSRFMFAAPSAMSLALLIYTTLTFRFAALTAVIRTLLVAGASKL